MSDFFDAIKRGDTAAITAHLDTDPSLGTTPQNGVSPILFAVYHGKSDVARLFVSRGVRPTFHEAAALGDLEEVRAQLANDPSLLDARSSDGYPALGLSIFFGQAHIAKFLIEQGADVNAYAENANRVAPVHAAAAACHREVMAMLLDRGADPNAKQNLDFTPLHGAASRGDVEMAKLLIARGADPHARSTDGKSIADAAREHNQPAFADWLDGVLRSA